MCYSKRVFIDSVKIFIKSGDGGNGVVSFYTEKYVSNGGPDGGDGGDGGDIVFVAEGRKTSLADFRSGGTYKADDGVRGESSYCHGKGGANLEIKVPLGTVIKDYQTGNIIADLFSEGERVVVLKGGRGGKGNARFKSSRRQSPTFAQAGVKTEKKQVLLELKTIADVGLVGFPNVGKSTLLSVLSSARPKIANYHFTTLSPNLGVCSLGDFSFTIADIPGLIEGAADGLGLGHSFLKHIERTRLIVHLVDISEIEGRVASEDYKTIRGELKAYSEVLYSLPEIVALNKSELLSKDALEKAAKSFSKKTKTSPLIISGITGEGLVNLRQEIVKLLALQPPARPLDFEPFVYEDRDIDSFEIVKTGENSFEIFGGLVDELARNVSLDSSDSVRYFQKSLKDRGVLKALRKAGIKEGDEVRILDTEFLYNE